jgi:hypothetical protein
MTILLITFQSGLKQYLPLKGKKSIYRALMIICCEYQWIDELEIISELQEQ